MFNLLNQINNKQKIIIAVQSNHYTVETKILDLFINNNKEYLEIEYINVPYNEKRPRMHTSSLFKEYPSFYLKGRIFETKKIIPFIYELLYPESENKKHFDYLIYFLYNQFRPSYTTIQSPESINEFISIINAYIDFFKDKNEKNFINLLIELFIEEHKEAYAFFCLKKNLKENNKEEHKENDMIKNQINEINKIKIIDEEKNNNINININRGNYINSIFVLKRNFLDNEDLLNKYSIQNSDDLKKKNKEIDMSLDEIDANRSWRNNIFSLGLFLGTTGILYLFSLKK